MTVKSTLVIPTLNRPLLLRRQLQYYKQSGYSGEILVADSSPVPAYTETSAWLADFAGTLAVRHFHLPDMSFAKAISAISDEVRTPYVAVIPDDDFLVPSGIGRCIEFLESDPGYIAANGLGILISADESCPEQINAASYYRQPAIADEKSGDRVASLLRNYSVTLFSMHRTAIWRNIFAATPTHGDGASRSDRAFSDELLQCTLAAAYGKIARVNTLYLVRQDHRSRNFLPDWYSWVTHENWQPSYQWFCGKVSGVVAAMDGISMQCARKQVDSAFSEYLRAVVGRRDHGKGSLDRMRQVARRHAPRAILNLVRRWQAILQPKRLSIDALMNPRSPHHDEFQKIYTAVAACPATADMPH